MIFDFFVVASVQYFGALEKYMYNMIAKIQDIDEKSFN